MKRFAGFILTVVFVLSLSSSVFAQSNNDRVVRLGFLASNSYVFDPLLNVEFGAGSEKFLGTFVYHLNDRLMEVGIQGEMKVLTLHAENEPVSLKVGGGILVSSVSAKNQFPGNTFVSVYGALLLCSNSNGPCLGVMAGPVIYNEHSLLILKRRYFGFGGNWQFRF